MYKYYVGGGGVFNLIVNCVSYFVKAPPMHSFFYRWPKTEKSFTNGKNASRYMCLFTKCMS